jgi:molecular chaperone GrpE
VVANILDALDDFARVLETDPNAASTEDVLKGVALVERKLMRQLVSAGLEKVGGVGEGFDPNLHEAIGSIPAETEADDQTVGAVFQVGYRFGGTLLRPAKVQVRMWQDGGAQ